MDVADSRPYWQYVAVMDSTTLPAHATMNVNVLPLDSLFWEKNFLPTPSTADAPLSAYLNQR